MFVCLNQSEIIFGIKNYNELKRILNKWLFFNAFIKSYWNF